MFDQAAEAVLTRVGRLYRGYGYSVKGFSKEDVKKYELNVLHNYDNSVDNFIYLNSYARHRFLLFLVAMLAIGNLTKLLTVTHSLIWALAIYAAYSLCPLILPWDKSAYYRCHREEILAHIFNTDADNLSNDMKDWVEKGKDIIADFKEKNNLDSLELNLPEDLCCPILKGAPDLPVLLSGRCYDYDALVAHLETGNKIVPHSPNDRFGLHSLQAYRNWPDLVKPYLPVTEATTNDQQSEVRLRK